MSTKISLVLISFLIAMMVPVYYSCESSVDNGPVYKGMIQGWVYEDSTKIPLSFVYIHLSDINDSTYTNDSGRFHFDKISMPRGEFSYNLLFKRSGYIDQNHSILIKSEVLYLMDSIFLKKIN